MQNPFHFDEIFHKKFQITSNFKVLLKLILKEDPSSFHRIVRFNRYKVSLCSKNSKKSSGAPTFFYYDFIALTLTRHKKLVISVTVQKTKSRLLKNEYGSTKKFERELETVN